MPKKQPSQGQRKVPPAGGDASARIDAFIAALGSPHREIADALRRLIRGTDKRLVEAVKWSWPCYTADGKNICGIMIARDTVNLVLFRGARLDDPEGLIEGTGRSMRHVKLRSARDIRPALFKAFIKQSITLK
jgi:hypothetical protein